MGAKYFMLPVVFHKRISPENSISLMAVKLFCPLGERQFVCTQFPEEDTIVLEELADPVFDERHIVKRIPLHPFHKS